MNSITPVHFIQKWGLSSLVKLRYTVILNPVYILWMFSSYFMNTLKSNLSKVIESSQQDIFLYWKGRVALYSLLKAMNIKPDDEIILPAYTCVVVPNAILYLGAKPVYVDISKGTYNMDINQVEAAITDRTKVIVCQNTYGLSTDLEQLNKIAKRHSLYTIEDCTHGFGGTYQGKPNGQFCDAAFFSTQWNKPFSTGIGGIAFTQREYIAENLKLLQKEMIQPSLKELVNLKILYWVRRYLINEYTYWQLVKIYRFLSKHNLVVGSSSGVEITSTEMPTGYFKAFSQTQAKEGLKNLTKLSDDLKIRKQNADLYGDLLKRHGKEHVEDDLIPNHAFLKYPLLVHDRLAFIRLAEQNKIELGDWFISPLHPILDDLSPWCFEKSRYPVATYLSQHAVNLPTTPSNIDRVLTFLEVNIEEVI